MSAFTGVGLENDDVDYGENECSSNSDKKFSWETSPHSIIIDSGASTSVLSVKWCTHVRTQATETSKSGEHHTAANGCKTYNKGNDVVTLISK